MVIIIRNCRISAIESSNDFVRNEVIVNNSVDIYWEFYEVMGF